MFFECRQNMYRIFDLQCNFNFNRNVSFVRKMTGICNHPDCLVRKCTEQIAVSILTNNTQVPRFDVITSLCGYSSGSKAWKVFVYVNDGASPTSGYYGPVWIITWNFSTYYWMAKWTKFLFKAKFTSLSFLGCKLCTH